MSSHNVKLNFINTYVQCLFNFAEHLAMKVMLIKTDK